MITLRALRRADMACWFSGAIIRSRLDIWYQLGLCLHAGSLMLSPKVPASGAFWVTPMTKPSSSGRSWQKLSWNLSGLSHR
ncbi:hypothetical protein D9M71_838350 [compost metagenome]